MRTIIAVTSIVFLGIAGPVLAQSNTGMDYTGRFDGTPPLGTSPEYDSMNRLAFPIDTMPTGSIDVVIPRDRLDAARCPPPKRGVAPKTSRYGQACP
ncbi:hypothetical protein HGP14_31600 [Rhizobium sp. P32RR-XVIII]|jgi:hypothetical protein|uniref:hypothetical protein n=1 Tax=Rhizobium sp. P32RR-XVIII TaxID=2726738 RepID=UPI001456CE5A|nr:hypothetical protein [Rhizobium sp. P32RR-XVIII]NLS07785.1 hypothetical protein [Rhizobium sp. P32RR-XVIII]